jgi:hypothetical protein
MSAEPVSVKRRINDELRRAEELGNVPIAFFCECDDDCYMPVFLSGREYDQAREDPAWQPLWREHVASDAPPLWLEGVPLG